MAATGSHFHSYNISRGRAPTLERERDPRSQALERGARLTSIFITVPGGHKASGHSATTTSHKMYS